MPRTGIKIIGDLPWGTHFCQFYQTKQDLIDVLVPYFHEGLRRNEFCMWVTSEPLPAAEAREALHQAVPDLDDYLQRGQIEILDYRQWYTVSGKFDPGPILQGWVEKENSARRQGYEGLRLTGNIFWLEKQDWKDFSNYEAAVHEAIGNYRMLAICTYHLEKCGTCEVIDVVNNHQFALVKQSGAWKIIKSQLHTVNESLRQDIIEGKRNEARLPALQKDLECRTARLQTLASELTLTEQRQRRRLSQILHDHLQQHLYAARLSTTILRRRTRNKDLHPMIENIDSLLGQCIDECRGMTIEFSPPVLDDAGLAATLEGLARHLQERYGLAVEVQTEGKVEPETEDLKVLLFILVREWLFNVVKHAKAQKAWVKMRWTPNRQICIEVLDDGIGIDDNDSLDNGVCGGGFGWNSIRERLEIIGGRLEMHALPGKGTQVSISAPSRWPSSSASGNSDPPAPPADPPDALSAKEESAEPAAKIRILVADDHALFRKGLLEVLNQEPDIEVVAEAADGELAVEQAKRCRPQVVLMDLTMPNLDGMEATRQITSLMREVRVIGLSAHREEDIAQALYQAGAVSYLSKDEPVETLISTIRTIAALPANPETGGEPCN